MSGEIENLMQVAQPGVPKRLGSAERMRLTRARKRDGMRVIPVEVSSAEIDGLIQCGLLLADKRGDRDAVAAALGAFLGRLAPKKWPLLLRLGFWTQPAVHSDQCP